MKVETGLVLIPEVSRIGTSVKGPDSERLLQLA